jgi:hypothetical protein
MLVKILKGMPFLVDAATKKIYAYEKNPVNPLCIGTYSPDTESYTLIQGWKDLYQSRLETYRASEKPRSRMTV